MEDQKCTILFPVSLAVMIFIDKMGVVLKRRKKERKKERQKERKKERKTERKEDRERKKKRKKERRKRKKESVCYVPRLNLAMCPME